MAATPAPRMATSTSRKATTRQVIRRGGLGASGSRSPAQGPGTRRRAVARTDARRHRGGARRRRVDQRRGLRRPVVVVDDVDDDGGDVVATAALVGEAHELAGGVGRVGEAAQHRRDAVLLDLVEQPVGAEQEPIAGDGGDGVGVDLHPRADAEGAGDDVALRVGERLLRGDAPSRTISSTRLWSIGELLELAVAEQVDAAVADVDEGEVAVLGRGRRRRASCPCPAGRDPPRRRRARRCWPPSAASSSPSSVGSPAANASRRVVDGQRRGDLATAVAAHAVGDGPEPVVVGDERRVLVVLPDLAGVGRCPGPHADHPFTSNTVFPIWSRSPTASVTGAPTFVRLTKVPFVEPRSSTCTEPSRARNTRACRLET